MSEPTYRLGSRIFSQAEIKTDNEQLRAFLVSAHQQKQRPRCLCKGGDGVEVVIVQDGGDIHMRAFALRGHLHDSECDHYQQDPSLTGAADYDKAIKVGDNGDVDYKVSFPLKVVVGAKDDNGEAKPKGSGSSYRRRDVGLLGVLHDFWIRSSLDCYRPGRAIKRGWDTNWDHDAVKALQEVLASSWFGKRPASEFVHLNYRRGAGQVGKAKSIEAWEGFRSKLAHTPLEIPQRLVLSCVDDVTATQYGGRVDLGNGMDPLWLSKEAFRRLENSFPTEFALLKQNRVLKPELTAAVKAASGGDRAPLAEIKTRWPGYVIGLFLVRLNSTGKAQVQSAALMATSRQFIPIDSLFERDVAHALVAAKRRFAKPLRYESGFDKTLPDFILQDTSVDVPMEVYGTSGRPDYEAKKLAKKAVYLKSGLPFWEWTPHEAKTWPDFPPAKGWAKGKP